MPLAVFLLGLEGSAGAHDPRAPGIVSHSLRAWGKKAARGGFRRFLQPQGGGRHVGGTMLTASLLALPFLAQASDPVHPDLVELKERWRGAMEACGVPALAMVLVEGDQVVHRVTLGRRDPGRDAPVTPETIFYIASATKP